MLDVRGLLVSQDRRLPFSLSLRRTLCNRTELFHLCNGVSRRSLQQQARQGSEAGQRGGQGSWNAE